MRLAHLEAFRPICPRCRPGGDEARLELRTVIAGDAVSVDDGSLACPRCRTEYPILRGIPILVADVREHIAGQLADLRAGDDLSGHAESILGDCAGAASQYARDREFVGQFAHAHWGDLDPTTGATVPGGLVPVLEAAFALAGDVSGRWLDLGCATGRATFELAARTGELALGLDTSIASLRIASRIASHGRARYPVRRVGLVYDLREHDIEHAGRERVDFWCADATALPLPTGAVTGALSIGVLDAVGWPLNHLLELARVLADGGRAVVATPYDWTASTTALEGWLGGHSQRGPQQGSSAVEVRRILARTDRPEGAPHLYIDDERDDVEWVMRAHERLTTTYRLHMMRLRPDRA